MFTLRTSKTVGLKKKTLKIQNLLTIEILKIERYQSIEINAL